MCYPETIKIFWVQGVTILKEDLMMFAAGAQIIIITPHKNMSPMFKYKIIHYLIFFNDT